MVKGEHQTLWPTFLTIYATVCDPPRDFREQGERTQTVCYDTLAR